MAEYALVRIRRDTKEDIEAWKPEGVAWHVIIDMLYKDYIDNNQHLVAEEPPPWLDELFGGRADE